MKPCFGTRSAHSCRGLSLIELMVVVAVLAILATIAVPLYDRYVTSARRADGRSAATAVALAEERHMSVYQTYTGDFTKLRDDAGLDSALVKSATTATSPKGHYTLTFNPAVTANAFTVRATANVTDADCTFMTLNSAGVRGGDPSTNKCW
jgi:type IV pilus assembly protein PilE